ncbi:hypothetical protein [Actinacidiphila glaucinigra]|uniref:Uncharacterized protein n=1 Tax=Actinacidiphila glaucinigra TaxID=235986 RepID=A0A239NPD6_9ACTN|nr:hypothetical protein [Actinacidiphila glaucinigra]SNT56238.1 hypothetical protein SAMN05216252_14127 [Actinacidiphila glaucinigra]
MSTTAVTALRHSTAVLMHDYRAGKWFPTMRERDIADDLARTCWSEHFLRACLRGVPRTAAERRLCVVVDLAVQVLARNPKAATDGTLLTLRVLIDALTAPRLT